MGTARLPGPLGGLHLPPRRVTRYPAARRHHECTCAQHREQVHSSGRAPEAEPRVWRGAALPASRADGLGSRGRGARSRASLCPQHSGRAWSTDGLSKCLPSEPMKGRFVAGSFHFSLGLLPALLEITAALMGRYFVLGPLDSSSGPARKHQEGTRPAATVWALQVYALGGARGPSQGRGCDVVADP